MMSALVKTEATIDGCDSGSAEDALLLGGYGECEGCGSHGRRGHDHIDGKQSSRGLFIGGSRFICFLFLVNILAVLSICVS